MNTPPGLDPNQVPPYTELGETRFEDLCRDLYGREDHIDTAQRYGTRGHKQYGIDFLAFVKNSISTEAGQSKAYKEIKSSDVVKASDAFLKYLDFWRKKNVTKFVLFISSEVTNPDVLNQLQDERKRFSRRQLIYEFWDARKITNKLRPHPDLGRAYITEPYWFEVLFRDPVATSSLSGNDSRSSSVVVSSSLVANLENLGGLVSDTVLDQIGAAKKDWQAGRRAQSHHWIRKTRDDAVQWGALSNEAKAAVYRLEAWLSLSGIKPNIELAEELTNDAVSLFDSGEADSRLRALIAYHAFGVQYAIELLKAMEEHDSQNLLAAMYLEIVDYESASDVLHAEGSVDASDSESLRIDALVKLGLHDVDGARTQIAKAIEKEPDRRALRYAHGVIDYYSCFSPAVLPEQFNAVPTPLDWSYLNRSSESTERMRSAINTFSSLVRLSEENDPLLPALETWLLAALAWDSGRTDEAVGYCRKLLANDPANTEAIMWSLSRSWDVDLDPSETSLEMRTNETSSTTTNEVVTLSALYMHSDDAGKALTLLDKTKTVFKTSQVSGLWDYWRTLAMANTGRAEEALKFIDDAEESELRREAKIVVLRTLAEEREDIRDLVEYLDDCYEATKEPRFLLESAEARFQDGEYEQVADRASELISGIGTADAVTLGVLSAHNSGRPELALELIESNLSAFPENRIPSRLRWIRSQSHFLAGNVDDAVREAEELAYGEPTTNNLLSLFFIHSGSGNSPAAQSVAEKLSMKSDLAVKDELGIAGSVYQDNLELGRKLWRNATADPLDDDLVSTAVELGYRMGLDREMGPITQQMARLGSQQLGGIKAVSLDETVKMLLERQKFQQNAVDLYMKGEVPIHVMVDNLGVTLADFYIFDPAENHNANGLDLRAFHGGRPTNRQFASGGVSPRLNLDLTSLLFASSLGILDSAIKEFGPLRIPTQTVIALRQMQARLLPHQPARYEHLETIVRATIDGSIAIHEHDKAHRWENLRQKLQGQIDHLLFDLVESAEQSDGFVLVDASTKTPTQEEMPEDLGTFTEKRFVGCTEILTSLRAVGRLTQTLFESGLKSLNVPKPDTEDKCVVLARGTIILPEISALESLLNAGVLEQTFKFFDVRLPSTHMEGLRAEKERSDTRVKKADKLSSLITDIGSGLSDGSYEFIPVSDAVSDELKGASRDSLAETCLYELIGFAAEENDLVWIDDRYLNGFSTRNGVQIISTIDMLGLLEKRGEIDPQKKFNVLSELRARNVLYIGASGDEMVYQLNEAAVTEGVLVETTELESIRVNFATYLTHGEHLQHPPIDNDPHGGIYEVSLVTSINREIQNALTDIWNTSNDDFAEKCARSDWLYFHVWLDDSGRFAFPKFEPSDEIDRKLLVVNIAGVFSAGFSIDHVKNQNGESARTRFNQWMTERVVAPRIINDARLIPDISEWMKSALTVRKDAEDQDMNYVSLIPVLRSFYEDLPEDIKDTLGTDVEFMQELGLVRQTVIQIADYMVEPESYWSAVAHAIEDGRSHVECVDDKPDLILKSVSTPNSDYSLEISTKGIQKTIVLNDVMYGLTHSSMEIREHALRRIQNAFDLPSSEFEKFLSRTVVIDDPWLRVSAAQEQLNISSGRHYEGIEIDLRKQRFSFRLGSVQFPSLAAMLSHHRLGVESDLHEVDGLPYAESAETLLKEVGVTETILRLAQFPTILPCNVRQAVLALDMEEQRALLKDLLRSPSPMIRIHIINLLGALEGQSETFKRLRNKQVFWLTRGPGAQELRIFFAVLKWAEAQSSQVDELRSTDTKVKLAVVWSHSDSLTRSFLKVGAPLEWVEEVFERAQFPITPELFVQDVEYNNDVSHPRNVSPAQLLSLGITQSLTSDLNHQRFNDFASDLEGVMFSDDAAPNTALIRRSSDYQNSLGSYLSSNVSKSAGFVFGVERAEVFNQDSAGGLMEQSLNAIQQHSSQEPLGWLMLRGILGLTPVDPKISDQVRTAARTAAFHKMASNSVNGAVTGLGLAAAQIRLGNDSFRKFIADEFNLVAKTLESIDDSAAESSVSMPGEKYDPRSIAIQMMDIAYIISRSDGTTNAPRSLVELLGNMYDVWPQSTSILSVFVERLSKELPVRISKQFWALQNKLRSHVEIGPN